MFERKRQVAQKSMMHLFRYFLFFGMLVLFGELSLFAQSARPTPSAVPSPAEGGTFWSADLPGGSYTVSTSLITSVCIYEYTLEGGATRIREVSIDTLGSVQARFYVLETVEAPAMLPGASATEFLKERAREELDRLNSSSSTQTELKVVKSYPTTTHAHTVEFRLESDDQLEQLFQSVRQAWMQKKNQHFKLKP